MEEFWKTITKIFYETCVLCCFDAEPPWAGFWWCLPATPEKLQLSVKTLFMWIVFYFLKPTRVSSVGQFRNWVRGRDVIVGGWVAFQQSAEHIHQENDGNQGLQDDRIVLEGDEVVHNPRHSGAAEVAKGKGGGEETRDNSLHLVRPDQVSICVRLRDGIIVRLSLDLHAFRKACFNGRDLGRAETSDEESRGSKT